MKKGCHKCLLPSGDLLIPEKFCDKPAGTSLPFGYITKRQEREAREQSLVKDASGNTYPVPNSTLNRRSIVVSGMKR
jgi:hypothetical protein